MKIKAFILLVLYMLCGTAISNTYNVSSNYGIVGDKISTNGESNSEIEAFIEKEYFKYGFTKNHIKVNFDGHNITIEENPIRVHNIFIFQNGVVNPGLNKLMVVESSIFSNELNIIGTNLIIGINNIENYFMNLGYPNVNINFDIVNNNIKIDVVTGTRVNILNFTINSDLNNIELFKAITDEYSNNPTYSKSKISNTINTIKNYLDDNGYFNGKIIVDKNIINNQSISLNFKIYGFEKARISKINLINWKLDTNYQFKDIFVGDFYSVKKLKSEIHRLNTLGVFSNITPEITFDETDKSVSINLYLVSKKSGLISGGITGKGFDNQLFVSIVEKNFLNSGIVFSSVVTQDKTTNGFNTSLTFDNNLSIGYSLVRSNLENSHTNEHSIFSSYSWGSLDKTKLEARAFSSDCSSCVNNNGIDLSITHTFNRTDNPLDPTDGHTLKLSLSSIIATDNRNFFDLEYHSYHNLNDVAHIDNKLLIGGSFDSNYYNQNSGDLILRGMLRDHQIDGNILFGNKSNLYLRENILGLDFKPGAYIDTLGSFNNFSDSEYIYGINSRAKTGMGIMEIFYSVGSNIDNWDSNFGVALTRKF